MSFPIIASITLDRDYTPPGIDNTAFSNLSTWTVTIGSVNTQSSSNLKVNTNINSYIEIKSPTLAPVDFTFGKTFRVSATITTLGGPGGYAQAFLFNDGVRLPSGKSHSNTIFFTAGPGTFVLNLDLNPGGYTFDEVRIITPQWSGSWPVDFSVMSVVTTDTDYAQFNAGDVLEISAPPEAVAVVRIDYPGGARTLITAGPNLGIITQNQISGVSYPAGKPFALSDYSFCDYADLISFQIPYNAASFPYVTGHRSVNNIRCQEATLVCDVQFTGEPTITPATDAFASDGAMIITASSSHADLLSPVKFSLGVSPLEPAGEYENLSNIGYFTGLAPGSYLVYAVDIFNCFQAKTIVIPVSQEAYVAKYRVEYYDVHTHILSTCEVLERGFTGDVQTVLGGSSMPFTLSKNNNALNDKFDVLRSTYCELIINSARHFQFIGLFSQDDLKYKIRFTHGSSSWIGFLVPSVYSEEYAAAKNYPVKLSAGDNLNNLSQYDFVDDGGNIFTGYLSLRQVLLTCLKKTNLRLNVVIAVNKYATGMDDTLDPLGQTFIDAGAFLDDDRNPIKCDEALIMILKPFGAFVIQKNSQWRIIETDAQSDPYQYREFQYDGTYVGAGTLNEEQIISTPSVSLEHNLFADNNHNLEIIPAYGKISIKQKLKVKRSVFPTSLDQWQLTSTGGAYGYPFLIKGSKDKGMQLYLDFNQVGTAGIISPLFSIQSFSGYTKIAFKYYIKPVLFYTSFDLSGGGTTNIFGSQLQPWVRIKWRLLLKGAGVDYYFHERIGWNRMDQVSSSSSSVAIPTSHATTKTLTIATGLTLTPGQLVTLENDATHYFRATITSYDTTSGVLVVSSYANVGTGTFTSWSLYAAASGTRLVDNYIYSTSYSTEDSFELDVPMPIFPVPGTIQLQLFVSVEGGYTKDFTNLTDLHNLPSAIFPVGHLIKGLDPTNSLYFKYYKLREGTDAESSPNIIRSSDFNSTSNKVVWDSAEYDIAGGGGSKYKFHLGTEYVSFEEARVTCYPGGVPPQDEENLLFNNNPNFKENLEYELTAGDLPISITSRKELYENIFLDAALNNTSGWARRNVGESLPIDRILMRELGNQYTKPSWRLSGNWIGPDLTFTTIIRHTIRAIGFSITNPENPNGTGWIQTGSGQAWAGTSGYCEVSFDPSHTGNSLFVRQSNSLVSGSRVRIDFSIQRLDTSGAARTDRFVCVLFLGSLAVQKVTLVDGINADSLNELAILFNTDSDADGIGFYIENISGTGTCKYRCSYFRGNGVQSVRRYFINKVNRNDRFNLYSAELVQLIPAFVDTDIDVDNTGGGNTSGGQDGNDGGNNAGDAFSSGLSEGFGSGFGG